MACGSEAPAVNIVELVLLALAAAVYPTLLAGVILILRRPDPLKMLTAFLIGGITISTVAGIAIFEALKSSGAVNKSHQSSKPVVDIVIGVISLLVAWGIWSGHIGGGLREDAPRERDGARRGSPSWTERALGRGSATAAFIAGLVLNLPGVWYLDALTSIAEAKPSTASAVVQVVVFNVIMFALVELPIVAYVVAPDRAVELVNRTSGWGRRHKRRIAISLAGAVGGWLIAKAIVSLVR
jgi:hypothetical protein